MDHARRLELIRAKNRGGLTPAESEELLQLNEEVSAMMEREFPAPTIWDERIANLEKKLEEEQC